MFLCRSVILKGSQLIPLGSQGGEQVKLQFLPVLEFMTSSWEGVRAVAVGKFTWAFFSPLKNLQSTLPLHTGSA